MPHYEKVYNFDIEDNENYYVTEDGILIHNGYSAGFPEHKAARWEEYQANGGQWNCNIYYANMLEEEMRRLMRIGINLAGEKQK